MVKFDELVLNYISLALAPTYNPALCSSTSVVSVGNHGDGGNSGESGGDHLGRVGITLSRWGNVSELNTGTPGPGLEGVSIGVGDGSSDIVVVSFVGLEVFARAEGSDSGVGGGISFLIRDFVLSWCILELEAEIEVGLIFNSLDCSNSLSTAILDAGIINRSQGSIFWESAFLSDFSGYGGK